MTTVHEVPLGMIAVGERFRKDYGNIEALKQSITEFNGAFEPILLGPDNVLIAGGRRYQAYLELGLPTIPALYLTEVDKVRMREIELEENIQRKDLTVAEACDLYKEIQTLKEARYAGQMKYASQDTTSAPADYEIKGTKLIPAWTQNDTATLTGVSPATVSRKIALADAFEVMPELRDEDSEAAMFRQIDRRIEELEREIEFRRLKNSGRLNDEGQVILGDCVVELAKLSEASVDCIIIDPPYGVLEAGGIGRYESGVHFDDDPVAAMACLRLAAAELKRVAKADAHIYVFFGIKRFAETMAIFNDLGFDVDPIPLIWVKTTGSVVDWDYRYSNFYEPILYISARTRRLAHKSSNVFHFDSVPSAERSNVAEKPVGLLRQLLELSTRPGDLVLDCFAGSGSCGVAAKTLGRRYILIEKDESQWKEINNRLSNTPSPSLQDSIAINSSTSPDPSVESTAQPLSETSTPPDGPVSD